MLKSSLHKFIFCYCYKTYLKENFMKFERDYFIHYYDAGLNKKVLPVSLMRYFEDIATLQSESRGIGLDYYANNDVAWLIHKWDIKFYKYPKFQDSIKVVTTPMGFFRFYAFRKFEVYNLQKELIAEANSMWFFINTKLRKPAKINDDMLKGYNIAQGENRDLQIVDPGNLTKEDFVKEFFVRQSDIDSNEHVNNISYVDWAMETVPPEILKNYEMKRLKIIYKKETHYGSKIRSASEIKETENGIIFYHKISEAENEICLLESFWQK